MNRKTEKLLEWHPLQNWRLIRYWVCENYDVTHAELELLLYLHPIEYFTVEDFKNGELMFSWNANRFYDLINRDWIIKVFKNNGRKGGHNRYKTSRKFMLLYNRIHRIISGEEEIPESVTRNHIMKRDTYTHKVYSTAIKAFNNNKD